MLEWALWYALVLGWPVFPCLGKQPAFPSAHRRGIVCHGACGRLGHGFYDATCDQKMIEQMWWKFPDANIGLRMSNDLWGLDVDPRHGGDATLRELERLHGPLPRTTTSLTGGGGEHQLRTGLSKPFPPGKIVLGEGLDVQNEGHYIVVPPSIHPDTGRRYMWESDFGPDDCPPQPTPEWLEELIFEAASKRKPSTRDRDPAKPIAPDGEPIPEGTRENTLTHMLGAMRATGATVAEMRAALDVMNKRCQPPLPPEDLDRIASSIGRYAPDPPAATLVVNGQPPGGGSVNGVNGSSSLLAEDITGHWRATMVFDLGRQAFMKYGIVPGIFSELEEAEIDAEIRTRLEQLLPKGFSASKLRDVKYLLKTHLHTRMASGPSALVPFTNGVLDVSSLQWYDHSPEYRLTWRLPYNYDKDATCPQSQEWLLETCSGHKDQVETIRAFLRAALCGRTDLQRFLELVGPGGSGKGTLTRLAQALVGLENVAVTELKYLESNRFETSNLIHKRLIIITDAEQWAGQVSTLKALTGGDSLRVERKHVGKHLRAVAEGMVIVAANEPVTSADYTSGLERRRLPLPFLHRPHTRRNLLEIKGDHFEGALVDELPGIVNWVLAMPEDVMVQYLLHTDTVAPSLAESHALTLVQTNPLAAWADERLVLDPTPGVPVDKTYKPASVKVGIARLAEHTNRYECENIWLYPNYVAYCNSTGTRALSSRRFTALLKDLLVVQLRFSYVDHKTTNKGSQFVGIRFRTPADDKNTSLIGDEYCPKTSLLITGHHRRERAGDSEESGEGGEGSGEGFHGVDYGSEGSKASLRARYVSKNGSDLHARRGRNGDTSHTSLPALARGNTSLDTPLDPSQPHSAVPPIVGDWEDHTSAQACPHCRNADSPDTERQADGSALLRCKECTRPRGIMPVPAESVPP